MKTKSKSDRFAPGQTYFIVMFDDKELTVPIVQTLIYLKKGERSNGTKYYLFKELGRSTKKSNFLVDEKNADDLVLDQAGLIQQLKDCFDRETGLAYNVNRKGKAGL